MSDTSETIEKPPVEPDDGNPDKTDELVENIGNESNESEEADKILMDVINDYKREVEEKGKAVNEGEKTVEKPLVEVEKNPNKIELTDELVENIGNESNESEEADKILMEVINDYKREVEEKNKEVVEAARKGPESVEKAGGNPDEINKAKEAGEELEAGVNNEKESLYEKVEEASSKDIKVESSGEIREWLTKFHETRQAMFDKQKESEGFGVIGGVFKGKEKARVKEEYEKAKQEYETMRAEYVGDKINRLLNEKDRMAEAQAEQIDQSKGFGKKVYDAYKKMGEWNLGKVLGEGVMKKLETQEDDKKLTKIAKGSARFASKVISVRTAVSGAMLGAGLYLGAGAAAGMAAIGARRALSSIGAGFGSYDLMKIKGDLNAKGEELKIWKFKFKGDKEQAKLKEMSAEEAKQLSNEDILEKMDHFDISGQLNGINPKENPTYQILRKEFNKRAREGQVEEKVSDLLKQEDEKLAQIKGDVKSKDRKRELIAGGIGALVGSGGLAKLVSGVLGASEVPLTDGVESGNKTEVLNDMAEQTPENVNVEITPDNISQEQFTAAVNEGADKAVLEELKVENPEKYRSMFSAYIETKHDIQSGLSAEKISHILEDENLAEGQGAEFLQEKVNDGLLDEYRGEFYPKDTHFEYNIGKGDSIWKAANELVEENADKLKLAEADYQQVVEAGETKLDYDAWLDQKASNLVSQLNEAQAGNLADLIHENDVVVLEVGDGGELNLSFEEVSGEKAGHLSDNLSSANYELFKAAGFDVSPEVKMTTIASELGDKGVNIELPNGDHYKIYDWDRDGQPNVIMPDGSNQEMSVAEFQALMEKEGALIKEVIEPGVEAAVSEETEAAVTTVTDEIDKMLEKKVAIRQELIEGRDYEDLSAEEKAEYNYTDEEKKILSVKQYLDTYHGIDNKGEAVEYIDSKSDAAEQLIKKVEADPSILAYEDVKGAAQEIYTNQLDKELNEGFLGIGGPDHEDLYNNTVKLSRTMGLAGDEARLYTEYLSQGKELTEDNFKPWLEDGHLSENKFANSVKEFRNLAIHNELPESDKWEPILVELKGEKVMALVHQVDDNNYEYKMLDSVSSRMSKSDLQEILVNKEDIKIPEVPESENIIEAEAEVVDDKTDVVNDKVETDGEVSEELNPDMRDGMKDYI